MPTKDLKEIQTMGFDFIKKLPTPEEIRNQFPIDAELQAIKDARDKELKDVFTGAGLSDQTSQSPGENC